MGEGKLYRMYFGDLVKIHSCLPVCSPELVYAIFMVENGRGTAYSSPVDWSLLGCHLIGRPISKFQNEALGSKPNKLCSYS